MLAEAGARVIVPYLRGYGPTRFLKAETPRSGEQAALGADLLALMDALKIERAMLGGYDWGGRAACVVAALWPERVAALVSGNSYNIQNIARAMEPASPSEEASFWYQYYFHNERGRRGLRRIGAASPACSWRMWSPTWAFDDATFERTATRFRQSRLCRRRHPLLSASLRARRRRSGLCLRSRPGSPRSRRSPSRRSRSTATRTASIRARRITPGCSRPARASRVRGRRPQPAAGAAARMGARGHRRASDGEGPRIEIGRGPIS